MKELLALYADYSKSTNRELLEMLAKLPGDTVTGESGSYYGSILGIMNHLAAASVYWLKRLAVNFEELDSVRTQIPAIQIENYTDMAWKELPSLAAAVQLLDDLLVDAVEAIGQHRLGITLVYRDLKGNEQRKVAWHALLHIFNHQTHHRGQIAQVLDRLGIPNDFSNLVWKY